MRSMTGCGRCQLQDGPWEATVELRAVNHRFLDVSCRLPRSLSFLEDKLRKRLALTMKRGHVDVFVTVNRLDGGSRQVKTDEGLARAYREAAQQLTAATGAADDLTVARLMALEGVVTVTEADMDEEAVTALVLLAEDGALALLDDMRLREGESLRDDLASHLAQAEGLRENILARAPRVVEDYRERLNARLRQWQVEQTDPARLAQEVALMADRCAIDEELARLDSHFTQMHRYLTAEGEIGKKMDFLVQEMNREANTIGSKANDAVIAQTVVNLKSEIEKLREQVQNVE
ncbi:MAG: YicC/YloC family endoribonuclease [Aristaeellaceae bacterium]